jgi:hypothetical protein
MLEASKGIGINDPVTVLLKLRSNKARFFTDLPAPRLTA